MCWSETGRLIIKNVCSIYGRDNQGCGAGVGDGSGAGGSGVSGGPEAVSPLRWRMISLAFFATVINYLDRQTLSVAAPILREQFHMSNQDYSRVVSAFLFAYTIMNGLSGPMIDRLGRAWATACAWRGGALRRRCTRSRAAR